jgi:hypothetical protein
MPNDVMADGRDTVQRNRMLAAWDSLFRRAQQADACLTTPHLVICEQEKKDN